MPKKIPTYRPRILGTPEQQRRAYESQPKRIADRKFLNSAAWRRVRALKLRDNPLCERCQRNGRLEPATHVHHVKERSIHPELALELSNLESLCTSCHSSHHGYNSTAHR